MSFKRSKGYDPFGMKKIKQKLYEEKRKSKGLCYTCGEQRVLRSSRCNSCRTKRLQVYQSKKSAGICIIQGCTSKSRNNRTTCEVCSKKISDEGRRIKQTVLNYYGQKCNCECECKVTKFEWLTIDHKNNDGATQRKEGKSDKGVKGYRKIIRSGFPDDLQILCWNCNCAKGMYGRCI